ncbi:Protein transport protein yos1 [Elasticomyces elasticus]|nr:Protein transport protein yos1 [Elasticomyces elasticus]
MFFFGLGGLVYGKSLNHRTRSDSVLTRNPVSLLLVNAVAILSEDRFLARIGWGSMPSDPGFGGAQDTASVKAKIVNLITSVRTLMRSR